jgi:LysR family transcriptional regulator for bpeEF and oprC
MEVFVHVVDTGSFTRAADQMQLPKATVSTLVQTLESNLAVKLLNRTTRRINVTADGAAYYERCIRILSDVRDAEESLSRDRASPRGRLRVDASTAMSREVIVPALPGFFELYPDIELELGCSDRQIDLIEEGVDCAIRGGNLNDSTLIARRVGLISFVTCATPAYLARYGRPTHPSELERHRCVNFFSSKTGRNYPWDFTRGEERIELTPPSFIAVNDANAYIAAGLAGLGIVQIGESSIGDYVESGQFEIILPEWQTDALPIHVVYPQNRHLSAKVRVFVEWIAELMADTPGFRLQGR